MANRCYACKRALSNPESMKLGIGPVCRARRKRERDAQEKLDREVSKCHHGFNCANPHHVLTLLGRLNLALEAWPQWLRGRGVDFDETDINPAIRQLMGDIEDSLGLRRPPVQVPEVAQVSLDQMLQATGHHMHPANQLESGQYRIPFDIQSQYRCSVLREKRICPHGLDCREPERAVAAIYSILSILRNDLEPLFARTSYGGYAAASDRAYVACMNMLEVLGLDDEASFIRYQDLPKLQKAAQKNARRWERRASARPIMGRLTKEAV